MAARHDCDAHGFSQRFGFIDGVENFFAEAVSASHDA
jgi:hypothetical protein